MTPRAWLQLTLHAHLPFVRHPEHPRCLEEVWLFEAITECYLPLADMLERLRVDGIPARITLSLSPTLLCMLRDPLLQERYTLYLKDITALCETETNRTSTSRKHRAAAATHLAFLNNARQTWEACGGDLPAVFKFHYNSESIELITTAATHGYLPLLQPHATSVNAQLAVALETFEQHMGFRPRGFWLPECGFYPGLEKILSAHGIEYITLESHGLLNALPPPPTGVHAPIRCPGGPAAFARDPACAETVWSSKIGYPGHPNYREYYRDAIHQPDIDPATATPFKLPDVTLPAGLKFWRITGETDNKGSYDHVVAAATAREHARDFLDGLLARADNASATPPLYVAPYDAELFGHWWFEGPLWLEKVIRAAHASPGTVALTTGWQTLRRSGAAHAAQPAQSSWGQGGYHRYWINPDTEWLFPLLRDAANRLAALIKHHKPEPDTLTDRALRQAARCLLLAQASDLPFILRTGTTLDYAQRRIRELLTRFDYIHSMIENQKIDEAELDTLETLDACFSQFNYKVFAD